MCYIISCKRFQMFLSVFKGTTRIMKRYERKWKHICLKRVAHRSVQANTEPKTEVSKEQQEKQLVLQK